MPDEAQYITATRILEYHGPKAYVERLLNAGFVPAQGQVELPAGAFIRSGMILWEAVKPVAPPASPVIPIVPPGGPA
jgi:hypothetical protein